MSWDAFLDALLYMGAIWTAFSLLVGGLICWLHRDSRYPDPHVPEQDGELVDLDQARNARARLGNPHEETRRTHV